MVGRALGLKLAVAVLLVGAAACGGSGDGAGDAAPPERSTTSLPLARVATTVPPSLPSGSTPAATSPVAGPATADATSTTSVRPAVVDVPYVIEVRSSDPAVAGFPSVVDATLGDARGWRRADYVLHRADGAPYRIVLAEPDDAQALCEPYDVYRMYSCQNGPVVVINADRWRTATPEWTGDLDTYRQMLINHEVGHLLGQRHPRVQCPQSGQPAAVMSQQSTELEGCLPNAWPLDWEIALAIRHDQPLAPGYGE